MRLASCDGKKEGSPARLVLGTSTNTKSTRYRDTRHCTAHPVPGPTRNFRPQSLLSLTEFSRLDVEVIADENRIRNDFLKNN